MNGMNNGEPILVSVIMPVYNAERYLKQAVESVLLQEISLELLLIDDCSCDGTAELLKNYEDESRITVIRNNRNLGVAETRNIGIRKASGKYIAFLDADDWWESGKLKLQCELLEQSGTVLCYTGRELMKEDGSPSGKVIHVPETLTYDMLLKTNHIPCSSVVISTEAVKEFGMEHAELHEDYILWLKVLRKYNSVYGIDRPMLKSRMSIGGKSRNKLKSAGMQWGVYRLLGLGRIRACYYMIHYMFHGILKYSSVGIKWKR